MLSWDVRILWLVIFLELGFTLKLFRTNNLLKDLLKYWFKYEVFEMRYKIIMYIHDIPLFHLFTSFKVSKKINIPYGLSFIYLKTINSIDWFDWYKFLNYTVGGDVRYAHVFVTSKNRSIISSSPALLPFIIMGTFAKIMVMNFKLLDGFWWNLEHW